MSATSTAPSLTTSESAATSTNAIPNLHGGAHPATPKLAGIITGSCILFAWTLCFIYWWWNRRKEKQDLKEMEANQKMKMKENDIALQRFRDEPTVRGQFRYPPGTKMYDRNSGMARSRSPPLVMNGVRPAPEGRKERRRELPVPDFGGHGPMTPMAEVETRDEAGSAFVGGPSGNKM